MASNPSIRASDADRDRIATTLRENLAEGRLTAEEFDERLDKALAAKTLGELEGLMTDLPGTGITRRADRSPDRSEDNPPSRRARFQPARRTVWEVLFTLSVLVVLIWLISAHASLSFLWVVAALAVLVIARRIIRGRAPSERRSARPRRHHLS